MKMIMRFGVSFDGNDFEKEYGYIDFGGYSFVYHLILKLLGIL